jgi:hypothetical protein
LVRVSDIFVNGIYRMPEHEKARSAMKRDYRVLAINGRKVTIQIREAAGNPQDTYEMSIGRFAAIIEGFAPDSPRTPITK